MKTCGALLVLLCCCLTETQLRGEAISDNDVTHQGHHGEAETRENEAMGAAQRTEDAATACTEQTCQPDIHTVLREMNALIMELKVELRYTKTQMEAMESRLRTSEKTLDKQRVELRYTNTQMEAMETKLSVSENKAETMETRLRASETTIVEHREQLKQLKSDNKDQAVNINLTGSQVEKLWREREERKVSFSASMQSSGGGHKGPFSAETTVIFRHVFTNIGNGYNPNTGVFRAPVRGAYHFVLFIHGYGHLSRAVAVSLRKNGEHVVSPYSKQTSGSMTPSNGASLLLEKGDVVYVVLWANAWFYDNTAHHTTFSGHLLFPM